MKRPSVVRWRSTYLDYTDPCTSEGDPSEAERAVQALGSEWEVGVRTGDSTQKVKQAQKKKLPRY